MSNDDMKYPIPPVGVVVKYKEDDGCTVTYVSQGLYTTISTDVVADSLRWHFGLASAVRVQLGWGLSVTLRANQAVADLVKMQVSLMERILTNNRAELADTGLQLIDGETGEVLSTDAT